MGRTTKDRHDLDDDFEGIDLDFDYTSSLENNGRLHALEIDFTRAGSPKQKVRKKIVNRRLDRGHKRVSKESKDWKDPEDDIMYGF